MTTPILGITEISGNQQNQYITANEAFRALEAASNDFLTVDLAAGAVTLTDAQFTAAYAFYGVGHGVTTALNVPASKRAFVVINGGTANITVTRGAGTKTIAPGESMMLLTDGTSDGLYSVGGGGGGGAAVWGAITGTLSDQADLQAALDAKANVSALGTMAAQNANAVAIIGGAIDGTPIGATTRANGNFLNVDINGNLNFTGAARRITADFSNGTHADRTSFQTSTTNGSTNIHALPNGTSNIATFAAYSNSDPTNANAAVLSQLGATTRLQNNPNGSATAGPIEFWTSGAAQAFLSAAGNFGFGVASPDTSARIQSANGIKLGNTANANSQVLDWYERGTFTPSVVGGTTAGTATYGTRVGRYQRVGNRVNYQVHLSWSGHTGTGTIGVSGLPFAAGVSSGFASVSMASSGIALAAGNIIQSIIFPSSTSFYFEQVTNAGVASGVGIVTSGILVLTGSYEV